MEQTDSPDPLLAGTCLAFTPVPAQRCRADGWMPETQANFIRALEAMGSVGKAALRDERFAKTTKETF